MIGTAIMSVDRDVWDWLLYVASLLAAITAIVLFLPWALERRRRPEVRYSFRFSETGKSEDLRDWLHQDVIRLLAGQTVLVETAIQNAGDKPGELTLLNFVVPDVFTLEMDSSTTVKATKTKNFTAGLPPAWGILYCAPGVPTWTPGNWFVARYRLTAQPEHLTNHPLEVRLLLTVSDPGFNRSGRRWIPSIPPPVEPLTADAGQPWPPGRRRGPLDLLRHMRVVRAEPFGQVLCYHGGREDVRDLIVVSDVVPDSPGKGGQEESIARAASASV